MTPFRPAALAALVALTGCGDSSLNPFSWFGGGSDERVVLHPDGGFRQSVEFRNMVAEVTRVSAEQSVGGIIVNATGLPARQGYWNGELVSANDFTPENGVLELQFRIAPPAGPTQTGTPRTREVDVGLFITRHKLAGVREIRIVGQDNSRSIRR